MTFFFFFWLIKTVVLKFYNICLGECLFGDEVPFLLRFSWWNYYVSSIFLYFLSIFEFFVDENNKSFIIFIFEESDKFKLFQQHEILNCNSKRKKLQ